MQLEPLCLKTTEVAKSVGTFIRQEFQNFKKERIQFKAERDLVSYVDLTAEKMLIEALAELLPEAGFITEESHSEYRDGLNWIVDPLDGTTNFAQGVPHFCVSIALAQGEDVLLGVVYEVHQSECFWTWKGGESYCNGTVISVSDTSVLKDAFMATGFSVKNIDRLEGNMKLLKNWIQKTRGIRRLGTAALDLCYVAKGVFDGYHESDLSAWDVAAGSLIVKNAGGLVSDFDGGSDFLFGNTILAANKPLQATFLKEVQTIL